MFAIKHKKPSVDKLVANNITEDTLEFTEFEKDGSTRTFEIYIGATTEAWRIRTYINDDQTPVNDWSGMGWVELLKQLRYYITVPVTGTPEYNNLLTEYLDANGKKVSLNNSPTHSSTKPTEDFTEKFKNLCKHISDLYGQVKVTYLEPKRFSGRLYNRNDDLVLVIQINYLPETKRFRVSLYANDKIQANNIYMPDWDSLLDQFVLCGLVKDKKLCEWLDSNGKTVHVNNSPAPSKSSNTPVGKIPDQTYRYKRLLAQIDADGFCKYTINVLDSRTLDITLKNGVAVKLERNDHFPIYTLTVEDTSQSFDDYEDVLDALIIEGIIGDTDLCESILEWQNTPALKTEHYSGNSRVRQKTRETVQKIIVDSGVEEIYANTFSYCEELQEVVLPDTVTRIDNFAFYACGKLTKINLPSSISFIAAQAFERCPNVVIYCEKGSYADEFAQERNLKINYINNKSSVAEDFKAYESLWD